MKTTLRMTTLVALLGMATMTAHAGVLTTDGVTFTSNWSGNVLTLEIDAANRSGGWSGATGLAALAIKGVGTYSSVSVSSSLKGTTGWTVSKAELNASGCAGAGKASTGNRLCFSGQQIALADDMVFTFTFNGAGVTPAEPHVKVEFVDARGNKVGSLLSQTLPATTTASTGTTTAGTTGSAAGSTTTAGTTTGSTASTGTTPAGTSQPTSSTTAGTPAAGNPATGTTVPTSTAADTGSVAATPGNGTLGTAAPTPLPPAQDLPTTIPVKMTDVAQTTGGAANTTAAAVPEPESIALLMGGLGLMGLVLRRRSR